MAMQRRREGSMRIRLYGHGLGGRHTDTCPYSDARQTAADAFGFARAHRIN